MESTKNLFDLPSCMTWYPEKGYHIDVIVILNTAKKCQLFSAGKLQLASVNFICQLKEKVLEHILEWRK